MRAIIFDTETTGIEEGAQVIEAAWQEIKFDSGELTVIDGEVKYFGTDEPISWGAMGTHHILPEDVAGFDAFNRNFIPEVDVYIGHKVDFDIRMCGLGDVKSIDTLAIARRLWPGESHNLSALTYMTAAADGCDLETVRQLLKNAHSALHDVRFCLDFLAFVCRRQQITSMEQLYAFAQDCLVPTHMPFGKFKDQPVSAVDNGYRAWYRKQSDTDKYILQAFDRYPYGSKQ